MRAKRNSQGAIPRKSSGAGIRATDGDSSCCCDELAPCGNCLGVTRRTLSALFDGITVRGEQTFSDPGAQSGCAKGDDSYIKTVVGSGSLTGPYCLKQSDSDSCKYVGYVCGDVSVAFKRNDGTTAFTIECVKITAEITEPGAVSVRAELAIGFLDDFADTPFGGLFFVGNYTVPTACTDEGEASNDLAASDPFDEANVLIFAHDGTATVTPGGCDIADALPAIDPTLSTSADGCAGSRTVTITGCAFAPENDGDYDLSKSGKTWSGFGGDSDLHFMELAVGNYGWFLRVDDELIAWGPSYGGTACGPAFWIACGSGPCGLSFTITDG